LNTNKIIDITKKGTKKATQQSNIKKQSHEIFKSYTLGQKGTKIQRYKRLQINFFNIKIYLIYPNNLKILLPFKTRLK
jgi:hypothetical protein